MTSDALVVDVSQDWAIACDVQQRFMQGLDRAAGTWDYSARCRQMLALGGDCYDFMLWADQRLALTIGDASGKGLAAALMISNVQSSLRTAALFTGNDLAAVLKAVNRQVHASALADRYATCPHTRAPRAKSALPTPAAKAATASDYFMVCSTGRGACCSTLTQAITRRWSSDKMAGLSGLKPVAHPSECFRIGRMRKALFSSIQAI